ncbi:MAG: EamA family transporter, partial [Chthoniobacterales bacterium]
MSGSKITKPSKLALVTAFAALYIIWGSTYLAIRFAIESIPPLLMAGTRFLFAGIIMFAIARMQGAPRATRVDWRIALIVGGCLLVGGNGGVTLAEQYVSSGLASLLVATVPIYIALLGWITGIAARPKPIVWLGLAGGFIGVGLLVGPALTLSPNDHHHPGIGMLILLVASFLWSAGSVYSRMVKNTPSPFMATALQMLCGGGLLTIAGLTTGELHRLDLHAISARSLGSFAYLIFVGAIIGYTAYMWLLRHCEPAKVATYAYVNPIVAVLLWAAFAGETLSARALFAGALIVGSVALVITWEQT